MTDTSNAEREIGRQPAAWRSAREQARQLAGVLPQPGERVAALGCGTSWFMAQAYASRREAAGLGETDAFTASQFPVRRRYDRVVAISRSGTTTEVVRAVEAAQAPVLALATDADCPVATAADETIALGYADEKSVVQTVFATSVLMLLRASLGDDLDAAIAQAESVLAGDLAVPDATRDGQVAFLGQDWAYGIAQEAALKCREAAQRWTEAYPQMEYRHGPISIAEPGRTTWIFGRAVDGLVAELAETGATVVDDDLDPVADLVRAQLFAVRSAHVRGLDPDEPRHLTRSVVLSGPH